MGEEIFKFKDEKPVPDKIFQYPVTDLGDEKVPIVIDNGVWFYKSNLKVWFSFAQSCMLS